MSSSDRLLVVVAHPDDETFGCGSMLALAAARGVPAVVCCATRGEAGEPAPGSGVSVEELAAVREAELRAAAAHLGVQRVEVLSYRDSGMDGPRPEGSLVAAPTESVVADVARVLEDVRPTVVLTLDGGDGHRDHLAIRDATLAAASGVARVYLQSLPRSLMVRWLEFKGMPAAYADAPGTPDDELTTVVDTGAFYERRWEAIRLHRSQVSPYEGLPDDLARAFLATDHLRRVVPPWTGGPVEHDVFG